MMLEEGEGVKVNYMKAIKCYKMAIEKGNQIAMKKLPQINPFISRTRERRIDVRIWSYFGKRTNCLSKQKKSIEYYKKGAEKGHEASKQALQHIKKEKQ